MEPKLSVIIPTFNNLDVLRRCLESWERFASDQPVELLVIEDGCKDATPAFLEERAKTEWGKRFLRWFHERDVHQLRCNNRGFQEARAPLSLVWDDDMFLEVPWLVPELLGTFEGYPEIGLLSLIRGLNLFPVQYPITEWEHLHDPRHMVPTVGPGFGLNWLRLSEVDIVIRPWVVRRACLDKVGPRTRRSARWSGTRRTWRTASGPPGAGAWPPTTTSATAPSPTWAAPPWGG